MTESAVRELADDPSSRKRFFKMMGGAGAVSAFSVLLAACGDDDDKSGAKAQEATGTSGGRENRDLEIVNYALTLEYLEAEFYAQVIASGMITDRATQEIAKRFGQSEQEHVDALKATASKLGGKPAAKPRTKFEDVIEGGPKMILATAATVENLGAAAYLGEAGNITSKEILAAALAIHSVEARHAAALNQLVGRGLQGKGPLEGAIPDGAFAKPMSMDAVLEQVKPFIAA